ncbi:type VII secretion integral membrane protein EccD [Jatrophihabitans endophyticus]|uniref:type VII secretion integral membrane protein EccD n=1 Tax=Jatrophihabitans endophyticus TaxID=1206085 RepID=UPI0019F7062F|nr:type VII secretion integral membrane protein EccD [Jatrophihabitans endophyticus]MBE7186699.1 type VII secretion integral membrane protein EccD [Jatrophihabitans endophyticus]
MTAGVVANSCRLTIISSTLRVDLAVPMHIAVAELLTIVVSSLGRETADQGAAEGGFVLQRASEAPLDPSASLAASQVRDGDILYLRTRATNLPEVAFDDVLDAVATGVSTRTSRWTDVHTQRATATFAGALLVFALVVSVLVGPSWTSISIADGVAAVLLVLTASAVGRIYRRRGPALAAGGFAVAFAVACGAGAVGGHHSLFGFGSPQLLVAACAAALVSLVLIVVLSDGVAGFGTVVTTSLLTAIGTGIATGTTLSPQGTAAIVAAVGLAISPFLPTVSFRLSRLPLPLIPLDAADLRRDTSRVDAPQILAQTVRADAYLTGLVGGVALAIAGSAVIISGRGTSEHILTVVLGLICLLRARLFTGLAQRAMLLVAGGVALGSELVSGLLDAHGDTRLLAYVVPAVVVAVVLTGLAVVLPGRRYAPPVARAADVLESLLVLSVIPLALGVMGVYGAVRHLHNH